MLLFRVRRLLVVLALGGLLSGVLPGSRPQVAYAAFSLTVLGQAYTQNFNSLPNTGTTTWTNDSTITAWYSNQTTLFFVDNGTSTTGGLYSYGTTNATDRALGSVGSAAASPVLYGVHFVNNTFATITSFDISYVGEQWRRSGVNAVHTLVFEYQIGTGLTLTSGTWLPSTGLDFDSPTPNGAAGALNGNSAGNRTALTQSLVISVPANQEVMFRWRDINDTGADHGLAIDDLSITPRNPTAVAWAGSALAVDTEQTVAGAELTYNLTVSDSAGGDFSVSDTFDPRLTVVSAPGMQLDGQTVSASGVVAPGERRSFRIRVRVAADYHGLLTNSASGMCQ